MFRLRKPAIRAGVFVDRLMTVHTIFTGRNARLLAVLCTVAVQAVDLVGAGVYFMRVEDGLFGLGTVGGGLNQRRR